MGRGGGARTYLPSLCGTSTVKTGAERQQRRLTCLKISVEHPLPHGVKLLVMGCSKDCTSAVERN